VGLVRGRFPGKNIVYTLFLSPMIIPLVVMAIALYFLFVRFHLVGTYTGLVMAHTMLAIPFVVINVSAVLQGFDITLENAAMNLGANKLQSFFRITLPLIAPGIFSGALFAFITSFDEIIIAMFISGTSAVTVQKKIWDSIRLEINPMVSSIASLLILLSVIILVGSEIFRRKAKKYRTLKG
jgi:putative spermidine/putrescine transport system permease protein